MRTIDRKLDCFSKVEPSEGVFLLSRVGLDAYAMTQATSIFEYTSFINDVAVHSQYQGERVYSASAAEMVEIFVCQNPDAAQHKAALIYYAGTAEYRIPAEVWSELKGQSSSPERFKESVRHAQRQERHAQTVRSWYKIHKSTALFLILSIAVTLMPKHTFSHAHLRVLCCTFLVLGFVCEYVMRRQEAKEKMA